MKKAYLPVLILVSIFSLTGQTTLAQEIKPDAENIESFYSENYLETVYIHTDKPYYLTGELIRFKVYCLEKITSKPSQLSKVAYVEVLDENNAAQVQAKIELENGTGFGEMYIPTTVNSGNMVLRGYTRWMQNYGPEGFYHSVLTVINPFKRLGLKPVADAEKSLINFFPEGGSLIQGLKTNVVFECKDEKGYPIEATGRLLANDTVLVQEFKTEKIGFGSFSFTPEAENTYIVELVQADGTTTNYKLPKINTNGFNLQIVETSGAFQGHVFCNDASVLKPGTSYRLLLLQKGKVIEDRIFSLAQSRSSFEIDRSIINEGVSTIVLLKESGQLLSERKIFKYGVSTDPEQIKMNKTSFQEREKVIAELPSFSSSTNSGQADFSLSTAVYHKRFERNTVNFSDYILLDNELQFVYGVSACFDGSPSFTSALINKLLIAYPGKSDWQKSINIPKLIPEYRGPLFTAKVTETQTQNPASAVVAYLSVPGKLPQFYAAKSKNNGELAFEFKDFYGKKEVIIQTDYTKDSIYSLEAKNPFSDKYLTLNIPKFDLDENMEEWIRKLSENMQVENSYLKYRPVLPALTSVDSSNFYNEPDSKYNLDDYTRFIVMEEVMREYVSGVNVKKNRDGYHFMTLDIQKNIMYSENPLMLLDGLPVFDADEIMELDPLKVERIETIKGTYFKGLLDNKGIVNYATYKGNLDGYAIHKDASLFEYEGIQPRKQYYFPTYTISAEKRSKAPDFRNTLYWNPNIIEADSQPASLEFYTSDEDNKYEIRVEGFDEEGRIFSAKTFIEVNK